VIIRIIEIHDTTIAASPIIPTIIYAILFVFSYSVNIIKKPETKKSQANYFEKVINNLT